MNDLTFSGAIKIPVVDGRNGVMLDYPVNGPAIHYFCLLQKKNEETGEYEKDENNNPVLCIARFDYSLDDKRNYVSALSSSVPYQYNADKFIFRQPKDPERPDLQTEPYDVISFNVKNFITKPNELKKVYGFINVKGKNQPLFRYETKLEKKLITLTNEEVIEDETE